MSRAAENHGVLGSFVHLDRLIDAIRTAQDRGFEVQDVFTPMPVEEVLELVSPKKSPVRFVTFFGGFAGVVGGFALCLLTVTIWNIIVGGKPVTNFVPFVVVGFELLVLLGALATFLAVLVFARLPYRKFPGPAYRPEFSNDRFGLWLACKTDGCDEARELLIEAGAETVHRLGEQKEVAA